MASPISVDVSTSDWFGIPGQNATAVHPTISNLSEWSYVECDENLDVWLTLRFNASARMFLSSRYYFNVYACPKYFTLTRPRGAANAWLVDAVVEGVPIPDHGLGPIQIIQGELTYYDGVIQQGVVGQVSKDFWLSRAYVGNLRDFGWNEEDQEDGNGTFWICAICYGYSVTNPVTVVSFPITVPGMKTWLNYFPWESWTPYQDRMVWKSLNSPNCYLQMRGRDGIWWDKKNTKDEYGMYEYAPGEVGFISTVLAKIDNAPSGNAWVIIPETGENVG